MDTERVSTPRVEEQKLLNGSGTGEPRGILQTAGISTVTTTATTGQGLIDDIITAILNVQTGFFGSPTGILMHPRRLAYLAKTKDAQSNYIFNSTGAFREPSGLGLGDGTTSQSADTTAPMPTILGVPVGTSTNVRRTTPATATTSSSSATGARPTGLNVKPSPSTRPTSPARPLNRTRYG